LAALVAWDDSEMPDELILASLESVPRWDMAKYVAAYYITIFSICHHLVEPQRAP